MPAKKKEPEKKPKDEPLKRMGDKELAQLISRRSGLSIRDIENVLDILQEIVVDEVFLYDTAIMIRRFGMFWRKSATRKVSQNSLKNLAKDGQKKPKRPTKSKSTKYVLNFTSSRILKSYTTELMKKKK